MRVTDQHAGHASLNTMKRLNRPTRDLPIPPLFDGCAHVYFFVATAHHHHRRRRCRHRHRRHHRRRRRHHHYRAWNFPFKKIEDSILKMAISVFSVLMPNSGIFTVLFTKS